MIKDTGSQVLQPWGFCSFYVSLMSSNISDKITALSWWGAGDHSVWLMYARVLTTVKLENATENAKSWKRLSCISKKIERCHLLWLNLPFLREMLWKLTLWKLFSLWESSVKVITRVGQKTSWLVFLVFDALRRGLQWWFP